MNAVQKFAIVLSLSVLTGLAASAASPEDTYLKAFTKGPGVPEPVRVVAPEVVDAPAGAEAMISFVVDIAGVPQSIEVAHTTHEGLAAAAIEAVRNWRFTPVVRGGATVPTKVMLPVRVTKDTLIGEARYAAAY